MKTILLTAAAAATLALGGTAIAQKAPAAAAPAKQLKQAKQPATRAQVQARIAAMFTKLDTNKDGSVTKQEMAAVESKRAEKIEQRAEKFDPAKAFVRLDANKDGKISVAEADAVRPKGAKAAAAKSAGFHGLFARADINKDGTISKTEFDAMGLQLKARMEKAGDRQEALGARMFDQSDANKDGKVTLAELQQPALARFDRADANHDGKISADELKLKRQVAAKKK